MHKRLVVLSNNAEFFIRNFEHSLRLLKANGYELVLVAPPTSCDLRLFDVSIVAPLTTRGSLYSNLIRSALKLTCTALRFRKAIFLSAAVLPNVFGGGIMRLLGVRQILFFTGLGSAFIGSGGRVRAHIRRLVLRAAVRSSRKTVVVQNSDDQEYFRTSVNVPKNRVVLCRDIPEYLKAFSCQAVVNADATPVFYVPSRLLRDKGIYEIVEASKILERLGISHEIWFSGQPDRGNPSSLTQSDVSRIQMENSSIRFLGFVPDVIPLYASCFAVCLPSYREGLPNTLLEAARMCKPIIATDVPGCREVVEHGSTGLLVPPRDGVALADAMCQLLRSPKDAAQYGIEASRHVKRKFLLCAVPSDLVRVVTQVASVVWGRESSAPLATPSYSEASRQIE